MIKVSLRRKGLIGICMALALCILGIGAHSLRAASRVDTKKPVTITAKVADGDTSAFATEYKGKVDIYLYRIATMDETGTLTVDDRYATAGIDLSVLNKKNATSQDVITGIVDPAMEKAEQVGKDEQFTLDRTNGDTSATSDPLEKGVGLYLYIPQRSTEDATSRYAYEFTPYIVFAPSSTFITTGTGSDEWDYNPSFNLKSTQIERTGKLRIVKKLDQYNISMGKQSFVYDVKGTLDGKVVINNVYKIDFDGPGTNDRIIDVDIPATTVLTVTEAYPGSSYKPVDEEKMVVDGLVVIPYEKEGDPIVTAEFENTYSGGLIVGGIAAENTFIEDENGDIHFIEDVVE
ncbi:hypothetical protein [Pseudobutyrivibrio sp. UC1225]|uniref:hypothetical protein n=1 Tax=Pseudobutyrivibrio sp. UC1225 TaxID=1798185 RepID=UPI0011608070|nr:hypothetical protein [Pseudobutyrivibrio sp. UC1225]